MISHNISFTQEYIEAVNAAIKAKHPDKALTKIQRWWLSFVILGLLITNSLYWKQYERVGLGEYTSAQMSWMFRRAKIFWDALLWASLFYILSVYKITQGLLVVDDTDRQRSKNVTKIGMVHKIKDKKTSGYFLGQNIVFLLLVCEGITIPVGFSFYQPDPNISAWKKEDLRLRKKKVAKRYRPKKPEDDANYPTKQNLALKLIKKFVEGFPDIAIKGVVGDTVYGTYNFMEEAAAITNSRQVISKIRKTQIISVNNQEIKVEEFFKNYQGRKEQIVLRGEDKVMIYTYIRCKLRSHKGKYLIVALKSEHEEEYRYLIARDISWLVTDVIKTFAFRWLVEVFFQDWKQYEGWNKLAKQTGTEGSTRGVILSLLLDHALLLHKDQQSLFEKKEPLATIGSLRAKVMAESLYAFIYNIVSSADPKALFDSYLDKILDLFKVKSSTKHIAAFDTNSITQAQGEIMPS